MSAATTYFVDGTGHGAFLTSFWILLVFAVPSIFLGFGLLTPYFSVVCCVVQVSVLLLAGAHDRFHLAISVLNSGLVAVLGPGAYSIDARLFGRRLVSVPFRK